MSLPPGDDGIFIERCGAGGVRPEGGQAPCLLHPTRMCGGTSVFLTCDVFGGGGGLNETS